ncbi:MAG: exodeoxyribonuclease V subunit alpha, partial [Aeromicrobium sp.]
MIDDLHDRRLSQSATGLLREFNRAEVLTAADVHVATRTAAMVDELDDRVRLAAALAVRAVRHGSVCVDLATVSDTAVEALDEPVELPWPEQDSWIAAVAASSLVEHEILRLEGSVLYLDRYWREERQVCADLLERLDSPRPPVDDSWLSAALDRVFAGETDVTEQRSAVETALRGTTTVLTGGPGTGKTTTIARLLAVVSEQHELAAGRRPRVAMCAPTAKAAARLQEAVAEQAVDLEPEDRERVGSLEASTIHRLLGWTPNPTRFRQHRGNRLPHDVVVVDETSMVSLTQMARLLEAVRPDARLVLVGDPYQLASIEAGAVLADIVDGLADHAARPVARLSTVHRYGGAIGRLAEALRCGDVDAAMVELGSDDRAVQLIDPDDAPAVQGVVADVVERATAMWRAAEDGDTDRALAALGEHRLLCAHREGRFGVRGWNMRVERG